MKPVLRVLHLERDAGEAARVRAALAEEFACEVELAENRSAFTRALGRGGFDLVLADYFLPGFDGSAALQLHHCVVPPVPFIFVAAPAGEEITAEVLKAGAADYVLKNKLHRLPFAVKRALQEAREAAEQRKAIERGKHLNAVLRAVRNVNQLITREKDRGRLLKNACECLIETRGYHYARIFTTNESGRLLAVVEAGLGPGLSKTAAETKHGELPPGGSTALHQADVVTLKPSASTTGDGGSVAPVEETEIMTVRLEHGGRLFGLLSVGLPEGLAGYEEERLLFKEVADDLAFALYGIELEEKRRLAKKKLDESETRYRVLVEAAVDAVFSFDENGRFLSANTAAAAAMGRTPEDMVGLYMSDLFPPEIAERQLEGIRRVFRTGEPQQAAESLTKTAQGDRWFSTSLTPLTDETGAVTSVLAIARDVTKRRRAEEKLHAGAQRLHSIFHNAAIGIALTDMRERFVEFNDTWCRMIGYGRKALPRLCLRDVTPRGESTVGTDFMLRRRREDFKPHRVEKRFRRLDGSEFWGDFSVTLLRDRADEPEGLICVVLDITERKKMEERLTKLNECMLSFGPEPLENINRLTALCGKLLNADTAFYTQLENDELFVAGSWNAPADFPAGGQAFGCACRRLIESGGKFVVMRDLHRAPPEQIPPHIAAHGWKTFAAQPLRFGGRNIGVLCAFFCRDVELNDEDRKLMGIIASAVVVEEKRRRAEKELRDSEERYRLLVDTLPDSVTLADLDGKFLMVNRQAALMHGYRTPEDFLRSGKTAFDLVAPKDRPRAAANARKTLEQGGIRNIEYQLVRKNGSVFPAEVSASTVYDADGRPKLFIGVARDITERKRTEKELRAYREHLEELVAERTAELQQANERLKQEIAERERAEKALRESEEQYRTLVNNVNIGVYRNTSGPQGRFLQANPAIAAMFGFDGVDDFLTTSVAALYQNREERSRFVAEARRNGFVRAKELHLRKKDGSPFIGSCTANAKYNESGEIEWLDGVIEDITERKHTEEALRESEQRFRTVFQNANDGILLADAETRELLTSNNSFCRMIGYEPAELARLRVEDIHPAEELDGVLKAFEQQLSGKIQLAENIPTKRKDGGIFFADVNSTPVTMSGRRCLLGIFRDVTARKRAEEMLRTAHDELERRVAARTAELSAVNERLQREIAERKRLENELVEVCGREQQRIGQDLHDGLCQQLTGTAMWCRALTVKLRARSAAEAEEMEKATELINQALRQTRALINGISPVEMKADGLLSALKQLTADTGELFGIGCRFISRGNPLISDNNVATHLYRIAQEALTNAGRHGKARRVEISLVAEPGRIVLTVDDNGVGIPDHLEKTTGMGLRIMNCRARMIGAVLEVQRKAVGGTTVCCRLPIPNPRPKDNPHDDPNS